MTDDRWPRIEQLYHAALERAEADRAAFLVGACGDDEDLRREVESLLAADHDGDGLLAESALKVAARELAADHRVRIGQYLGSYELLSQLGSGGMGEVYRARDVRLDRIVAIKVLASHLADDPQFRHRFDREARTISQLSHSHICALYDIGHEPASPDGPAIDFLVLEYLDGETLADQLRRGALPLDRALATAIEIGDALSYAHRHGIVHRDLKPGNVMMTPNGVKLLDFGLAKRVSETAAGAASATASLLPTGSHAILGTLPYMAPEQLEGKDADARSDVWAFGAVIHEMLTGRRAFDGGTEAQIINRILEHEPESAAGTKPAVSPDLDRVVRTCLAKSPGDRWADAHDVVVQLRQIADHRREAIPVRRTMFRSKALLVAAGLAAALAIIATVFAVRSREPTIANGGAKASIAVLYFDNNTGSPAFDWLRAGLADMFVTDLSQSPGVEVLGTDQLYPILSELHRLDDRVVSIETVREIAKRTGVQTVVLGSYVKAANAIRINIRIQNASSGRIVATERVDAVDEAHLFAAVDDLTTRVRARLAAPGQSLTAGATTPSSPGFGVDRDLADITT